MSRRARKRPTMPTKNNLYNFKKTFGSAVEIKKELEDVEMIFCTYNSSSSEAKQLY